jgi:ATP-dependent helicase HrpB
MRDLAQRWAREAGGGKAETPASPGAILAAAFPERIGLARAGAPGRFLLAGGRGALMDETAPLARSRWIVAADLTGGGADMRITLAATLDEDEALAAGLVQTREEATYDADADMVRARRTRRLGGILIEDTPLPAPSAAIVRAALAAALREGGLSLLAHAQALTSLIARVDFLAKTLGEPWPQDFAAALAADPEAWMGQLLDHARGLSRLDGADLANAARASLPWPLPQDLDRLAPRSWATPAGRDVAIDYAADGGPLAECKVQEAFGLSVHPAVASGRVPLTLGLLSPAQRPVAITKDLPSFWRGGYADMRKDMRGRYPKHDWPDDPASATPTSRAKKRPA